MGAFFFLLVVLYTVATLFLWKRKRPLAAAKESKFGWLPVHSWHVQGSPLLPGAVGSGAAEKVCGLERTREGATMGNFNFYIKQPYRDY